MSPLPSAVLSELLLIRVGEKTLDENLGRLTEIARDALDGVDEVSITLIRADRPYPAAFSGPLALDADESQYERGYGPCIDAGVSGTVLYSPDMSRETRWPDYAADVVPKGVRASLAVPLPLQTDLLGGLNCYSRTPHPGVDGALAVELAALIAVLVANAFAHTGTAEYAAQMKEAMVTRSVIEQAKGVIMAQNRCAAEEAFEVLRPREPGHRRLTASDQGLPAVVTRLGE